MKTIIMAAATVLLAVATAEAKNNHYAEACNNDGRCFNQALSYNPGHQRVTRHKYLPKQVRSKKAKRMSALAKAKRERARLARLDANGNRIKGKTPRWNTVQVRTVQGLLLTVHPAYAYKFLRLFEIFAENGVKIPKDMVGCFSTRGHVPGSNHYLGIACDIQTGWNRTIPALANHGASKWIRQAGLYDGCDFGDCGHIEGIKGTFNGKKLPNLYAA